MLIASGRLDQKALRGEVAIVSGAGGGIGLEAARSLLWLGATVVIAELDAASGRQAEVSLAREWGDGRVRFIATDVGDEQSIRSLVEAAEARFGKVDVVLNNATYSPVGMAVTEIPVEVWDRSYAVNLRGPASLARACLPQMIGRRHGVFVCVSSTGGPYLAAYETLKAAQLALANTLDGELEGSGVIAFTIGPGLVPTRTATAAIELLAPRLGTTVEEFWATNRAAVLSVEAAGAGFAAAIALAERYAGQEISSSQALIDAGIELPSDQATATVSAPQTPPADMSAAVEACSAVEKTLAEQAAGWKERSFFERQWMLRDFKQRVGMPVERCLETLGRERAQLAAGDLAAASAERETLEKLGRFYAHLFELARGYVKDPRQREEQLGIVAGWQAEVDQLLKTMVQGS